jgi:hypothetical protein
VAFARWWCSHSPADELRDHVAHLPFPVVADPGQKLYAEFGVGSAPRALVTPAVWPPMLRAILRSSASILRGRELPPRFPPAGGRLGLPADFLITVDGHVAAAKYGEHAYDQWSVDELLRYAGHLLNRETGASGHDWRDREEAAPHRADRSFRRR